MKKIKKIIIPFTCILTIVTCVALSMLFILDSSGAVNIFADQVNVVFCNWDNSFLWKARVPSGSNVTYGGKVPTKEDQGIYEYNFVNWDKSLINVTKDTVFHAQFQSKLKEYKVVFQNWNGKQLYIDYVRSGETAKYIGAKPTRDSDEYYKYEFKGWDTPITNVKRNLTVTAEYDTTPVEYTVTFVNNGEILYKSYVCYQDTAVYKGPTPTKEGNASTRYEFTGWDKSLVNVTEDFTTNAVFTAKPADHTVRFVNYDQELLYTTYVAHGETAQYVGPIPYRKPEGGYSYVFKGWNKSLTNVTSDMTVVAEYTAKERQFTVSFFNYDDTYLYGTTTYYGRAINYKGVTPERPMDEMYEYTFIGWDRDISYITEDLIVYAKYQRELRSFRCVFRNYNGAILYTTYVHYGDTAVYMGDTPVKEGSGSSAYKFIGWDFDLKNVTEDMTFTAQYEPYQDEGGMDFLYRVEYHNWDGQLLDLDVVKEGGEAVYGWDTPTRASDEYGNYTFVGWSADTSEVYESTQVFAEFETEEYYIVSYRNNWGELLYQDYIYKYGDDRSSTYRGEMFDFLLPENGFLGWDQDLSNVDHSFTTYPILWEMM